MNLFEQTREERVLHLTLKRCWFNKILSGRKRYEFREAKPYWTVRLENKIYDTVIFKNGYAKSAPKMKMQLLQIKKRKYKGNEYYCIELGQILESSS